MSPADLQHLKEAVHTLQEIYTEYPEIFTSERESILLVALEIINE